MKTVLMSFSDKLFPKKSASGTVCGMVSTESRSNVASWETGSRPEKNVYMYQSTVLLGQHAISTDTSTMIA